MGFLRANAAFKNVLGAFPNASKRLSTFMLLVQTLNNVLSRLKSPGVATVITFLTLSGSKAAYMRTRSPPGINDEFLDKIREFQGILSESNIKFEVKVASTKRLHGKMHDRYVLGANILWSLPPAGSVLDGQSSVFKPYSAGERNFEIISKDYLEWWNDPHALEIGRASCRERV